MYIGISANTNVERRKGEDTRNFQSTNPKVDSESMAKESPPPPPMKRIDQMRLIRDKVANDHDRDQLFGRHCRQQTLAINFWLNQPKQHDSMSTRIFNSTMILEQGLQRSRS